MPIATQSALCPNKKHTYEIVRQLARGGMGTLYLCQQPDDAPTVIKVVHRDLRSSIPHILMFHDEARVGSILAHPNIVRMIDCGHSCHGQFIAFEYVDGFNLIELAKAAGGAKAIPTPLRVYIAARVAEGLAAAHELRHPKEKSHLGLVHADVSPSNILVSKDGEVKIADFGAARFQGESRARKAIGPVGKTAYFSPEQCRGEALDARSDIFSLGTVLHELLSGQRLFKRASQLETMLSVLSRSAETISLKGGEIDRTLEQTAVRALAKDRGERYETAREMMAALDAWLVTRHPMAGQDALARFVRQLRHAEASSPEDTTSIVGVATLKVG